MDKEKVHNPVFGMKKRLLPYFCAAIGVILLAVGGTVGLGNTAKKTDTTEFSVYTEHLEERIRKLIESVDGIENVTVLLTLDSSTEAVYGKDGNADYVILSNGDGEEGVRLYEIYPRVRGVAVVCSNGDIPRVRECVIRLLSASLGIPSSDIEVAGSP